MTTWITLLVFFFTILKLLGLIYSIPICQTLLLFPLLWRILSLRINSDHINAFKVNVKPLVLAVCFRSCVFRPLIRFEYFYKFERVEVSIFYSECPVHKLTVFILFQIIDIKTNEIVIYLNEL